MRWLLGVCLLCLTGCAAGLVRDPYYGWGPPEQPLVEVSSSDRGPMRWITVSDTSSTSVDTADRAPSAPASGLTQGWSGGPSSPSIHVPAPVVKRILFPQDIPYMVTDTWRVQLTAYNSTPNQTDGTPWKSASGRIMKPGDAACNGLPFGTIFRIPSLFGQYVFTIVDRMAPTKPPNCIDLWTYHVNDAKLLGAHQVTIELLGAPRTISPP